MWCAKLFQLGQIWVNNVAGEVTVNFTPTIPHCSMATLIGLSLRVKLLRSLPSRYKVCSGTVDTFSVVVRYVKLASPHPPIPRRLR